MPEESEKKVVERAREDAKEGKSPSTQAGEFVREEMHHVRQGKHGARSPKQAIAIGLSKARRAGVDLAPPKPGKTSGMIRKQAQRDLQKGRSSANRKRSPVRSRASARALRREGHAAASHKSLSREAKSASRSRGAKSRREAGMKAAHTRRSAGVRPSTRKAVRRRAKQRKAA